MNNGFNPFFEEEEVDVLQKVSSSDQNELVVFNDDINTFEHVAETLVNVCKHSVEQAEQCTWIIHFRGKCTVKLGSLDELQPMRQTICDKGISAEIV